MIPLFVLALLSLIASTSAQCTSYPDNFGQYAVSLCPLPSNQRTPPVITSPTVWVPTGSVDLSVSTQFTLAFPVMIYGVAHSQFFFNTNGALFFGTTGITSDTLTLPLSASNTDALPVIAPLWVDQYMVPGVASGVFGTIGAVGNRTQIIRFINNPYDEPFRSTTNFTYDVVFYEAQPNVMEFRYYSLLNVATWTKSLTIGIQSFDDGGVVHTIVSGSTQWAVNQPLLNGNMITYRYVGTPTSEERCSGLGYDFESIRGTQLNYTDASGVTWLYSPCGRVTDARCAGNPATDKAMVCQIPVTGTPVDLGIYGPGVVDYQYPAGAQTGVEAVFQSGSYCSSITASRLTYVSYECDATATTPSFYAATTPSTCVYRLNIRTNLACGGGARGNDTQYLYPPSTLPFCNRVTGAAYDAILCPQSAAQRRAPEYPAMTPILQNVGTGTLAVTLQFPFWFYGNNYTTAYVSMNGAIYFGATSTATPGTAPTMGFTNPNTFPAIFAFGTSMSALNYAGLNPANITHTHTMINGRRAFVARYWDMKYTSSRGLFDVVMSFDIVLTEAPANRPAAVEIKYYRVTPSNTNNVQIGIHGPYSMDVYTSYSNNVAMNGVLANQLQGAMLSYNYTGRTLVDACVGYGIDFSTVITSDLQVTDGAYTYVVNPCGALRSTAACPAGTTVCQIPNGQTTGGFVLGVANPAAVTWSQSPGSVLGIRSTINSGAFCTVNQQARMVNLDWVCSRTVSVPTLVSMQELSTCTYTGVIYTPQVCTSPLACTTISAVAYRGEFCPVTSPKVVQTSPVRIFTAQEDDDAIRITLPFEMMFYGQYYRYVWIGTNGLLAFGPSRPTIIGQRLPVTGSNLDYTPIIAGFWSDLEIIEQSYVSWSVNTINGRRAVVIRYENVEFYGSTTAGVGDAVSFDVLLWEGQSGDIEVRYFTVNVPTSSSSFSVGIQGDDIDPEEAIIFSSLQPVNAAFAASYSNSTLKFTYTGPAPSSIPCAGLGYNFTALRNTQLVFNTSTTVSFVVNICNIVQDPVCSNSVLTDRSMVCRRTQAATAATATLASIGEWNPSEVWWRYAAGSTGVQLVSQTGVYCSAAAQPYTTILNFVCLATATTPTVTGILESPTCFVTINITTSLACGAGDRGLPAPIVNSTLPTCVPITGNLYNAVWCPRAANDPLNTPEVLVNPVNTLMTDNGAAIATFGFNFTIYGRQEAQVSISSNGVLTFGYTAHAAAANGAFPSMGLTADHYPAVAAFFTDLINVQQAADPLAYNGVIQVAWSGTSPNRRMIIRYQNIDYFLTRNSLAAQTASFDIVLYESNTGSRIDVRYYKIDAAPQYVVIGMHGYGQDYTQVTNLVPIGRSLSSQLSGSTLTYTWTGAATINACSNVPGGINLLQLSNQDIAFNSTSYAFFVRPCGIVSAPLCANRYTTSRVSVCQASFDGTNSWALASDNAAATVYTLVNATTLRATTNDGLLCGADPRRTVIDYVCNRAATTPFIDQQSENPGCTYNFRVQTVAACVNPVTIPGTAVGSPAVYYNAVVNQFDELPATKPTLTSPTTLALTDDDLGAVTSPFPIRVFGNTTTSLSVSANGFIGFTAATSPTGVPSVGFPLSSNYNPALPVLAVWTSDLHNSNKIGTAGILWAVQGTTPNRVLIIRYNDVNYYTNRQASTNPDSLLTFDVRLYESSNNIDVQYWAIGSYAQNVAVGIQGMTGSSTVLINAQSYAARGLYLQDRTVRYVYVDPAAPSSSSTGVAPSSSAVPSSSPVVPSSTVAPTSSARSSSSSSVAPSSTAPVATSSPIVTSSARSSSSSAPVTPTSAPVTPSTAAARSSSSSSSSSAAARSSSSSAVPVGSSSAGVSSSAGPSPSGPWPANSVRVTMNVVLPQPISASNYETIKSQLESDIIQNIADATGVSTSQLTGQVAVGSIGGLTSGARRLLQTETPVVFVILGTISDAVTGLGVDAAQVARNVANTLSTRVSEQRFTTTNSGATVPSGQSLSIAPAEGGDFGEGDSSSSSSLSDGAIAGIVIGSVVGGILLCVVLAALVLGWGRGNKHSTRMDDHSSHGPTDVELA